MFGVSYSNNNKNKPNPNYGEIEKQLIFLESSFTSNLVDILKKYRAIIKLFYG